MIPHRASSSAYVRPCSLRRTVSQGRREDQALARWTGAGGPAANAAVAFVALGGRATLLTGIGDGALPRAAHADLSDLGVKVVDLAADGNLPTSSVVVNESGHRTVVSLNAQGFDDESMAACLPDLDQVDVAMVDSHYPQVVQRVLAKLPGGPVPVIFDPGSYKPHVFELMASCNDVIASTSLDPTAPSGELLDRLRRPDVTLAAVTAGSEPTVAAAGDQRFELSIPHIRALDPWVQAMSCMAHTPTTSIGAPVREALEKATSVRHDHVNCMALGPIWSRQPQSIRRGLHQCGAKDLNMSSTWRCLVRS